MKNVLVVTLLVGSLAAGCQNADIAQESTASTQNAIATPTPTTAKTTPSPSLQPSTPSNTQVSAVPDSSQRSCQISAFVIDNDPKGLNVRSGPGTSYDIIGNLPTTKDGVFVDIAAVQGDWVQITQAESPEKVEFKGTGWVYAQMLGTSTRGYGTQGVSVYANANTQSSVVGRIPPEKGVKLLGCDRKWALVEYERLKGWIEPEDQCPNSLTTCP